MLTHYVLAILASYRLARMLATEEGPFGLFAQVRERFDPEQRTWLGRGLNCALCIGFYTSAFVPLLLGRKPWKAFLLDWFGIAGGMTALYRYLDG